MRVEGTIILRVLTCFGILSFSGVAFAFVSPYLESHPISASDLGSSGAGSSDPGLTQNPVRMGRPEVLADRMSALRKQVTRFEQELLEGRRSQQNARNQIKKIQKLLQLQRLEKALGQKRLAELEHTVVELESRRTHLQEKRVAQQKAIRKFLIAIESSHLEVPGKNLSSLHFPEQEKLEAPRRKTLANLVDRGLKEIEILRVDLSDAGQLESKIQDEKQQLAYLFQDLEEEESVLELNRKLQTDFLKRKQNERMAQLENYRKLKTSEAQVEHLIGEFNARMELERSADAEKIISKAMREGDFFKLKGKLPFPVADGRVVSPFGRVFDPRSGLYIFKKGIDIAVGKNRPVRAISSGKVAFSGGLPNYGQVVIIDHGDHFYSICAHLGSIGKKTNESVAAGDPIGITADAGTPLYFEIRSRNVAVNPLQWVSN